MLTQENPEDITTCQICGRAIKSKMGIIAHHGYKRPGGGWQTASCLGARQLPYEVSCDAIPPAIAHVRAYVEQQTAKLNDLMINPPATIPMRRSYFGVGVVKEITTEIPKPVDFDPNKETYGISIPHTYQCEFNHLIYNVKKQIRLSSADLDYLEKRLKDWKPKTQNPADEDKLRKLIEYKVYRKGYEDVSHVDWRTAKKWIASPPDDVDAISRVTRYWETDGEIAKEDEEFLFERPGWEERAEARQKNPANRLIMLTTPHAIPNDDHPFDTIARDVSDALHKALGGLVAAPPVHSDIPRDIDDQNRPPSRNSPFRARVRDALTRHKPFLLLDVHSFPDDTGSDWGHSDVAPLFASPANMGDAFLLAQAFRAQGLKSGAYPATAPHDVVLEALEMGVPHAILIECNENWKGKETALARKIAKAVKSL